LQLNFQNHQKEIYHLLTSVDACFPHHLKVEEGDQKRDQLMLKYLKGADKIKENLSSLQEGLDELLDVCAQSHSFSFGSGSEDIKITSGIFEELIPNDEKDHLTFINLLSSLKKKWSEIPLNECEAMKFALKYYKQSYPEAEEMTQKNQKIQAAYLIAELSRRVGNYQEAESYFKEAKRTGQDFIHRNRDDPNKIALALKIVELATKQGKLNLVEAESPI